MNDLLPTPGLGHNMPPPPDPLDEAALKDRLDTSYDRIATRFIELRQGAERLSKVIDSEEQAQRLVDFVAHQCTPAISDAKNAHRAEKAPYLACGRIIDTFFLRRIEDFESALKPIRLLGERYLLRKRQEQERREAEQRRRAAEEQHRAEAEAARLAAEAARAKEADDRKAAIELEKQSEEAAARAEKAQEIVDAPSAPTRIHGDYGATAYAQERWLFEVTDPTAIPLQYLRTNDEAIAAAIRRGVREIAGLRIYSEQKLIIRKC